MYIITSSIHKIQAIHHKITGTYRHGYPYNPHTPVLHTPLYEHQIKSTFTTQAHLTTISAVLTIQTSLPLLNFSRQLVRIRWPIIILCCLLKFLKLVSLSIPASVLWTGCHCDVINIQNYMIYDLHIYLRI